MESAMSGEEFTGGMLRMDPDLVEMDATTFEAAQRVDRKCKRWAHKAVEQRLAAKKQMIRVTLANLWDPQFKIGDKKQRRLAAAVAVRQKVDSKGGSFTLQVQRDAIIAYMEGMAPPLTELVVPGDDD